MDTALKYITSLTFLQLAFTIGTLIAAGFLLGMMGRKINDYLIQTFGWQGVVVTGIIGTPMHELGHLLPCPIFKHRVTGVRLFRPFASKHDGIFGYVNHTYSPGSLYQNIGNFYIGIGPIIIGTLALLVNTQFLVPDVFTTIVSSINSNLNITNITAANVATTVLATYKLLMVSIFTVDNFTRIGFWVFLFVSISVSSHISLSGADMKGAVSGIISLMVAMFFLNFVAYRAGISSAVYMPYLIKYTVYSTLFLAVSVFFSLITLAITFAMYKIKRAT